MPERRSFLSASLPYLPAGGNPGHSGRGGRIGLSRVKAMQYYAERELYHICPPPLAERLQALPAAERGQLEEVRLRLGYPAAMLSRGRETPLTGAGGPPLVAAQPPRPRPGRGTGFSA